MEFYNSTDLYPIFEDQHDKISLSSDLFLKQNITTRTIWLIMRIDGEIKNGGIAQLIWNLRAGFDHKHLREVLMEIGSVQGAELIQYFLNFIESDEARKKHFFEEYFFGEGMDKETAKLNDDLTKSFYKLEPSIETLLVSYANSKLGNEAFQAAISHLKLAKTEKKETELIFQLNKAIEAGNIKSVKKLLELISNPNQPSEYGNYPLLEVAGSSISVKKKMELSGLLLENGADINIQNEYGDAILHKIACIEDSEELIRFLVRSGAAVDTYSDSGCTPLFEAADCPNNTIAFIELGASLDISERFEGTAFTHACMQYSRWFGNDNAKNYQPNIKKVIHILLENGILFSKKEWLNKKTELAMLAPDDKLLAELLKYEQSKEAPEFNPDFGGWSAIFECTKDNNTKSLNLLIKAGASVNQTISETIFRHKIFAGACPLDIAAGQGVKKLLVNNWAETGARKYYAVYLITRGDQVKVQELIVRLLGCSPEKAATYWQLLQIREDESMLEVNGEYIICEELLLGKYENPAEAHALQQEIRDLGSSSIML